MVPPHPLSAASITLLTDFGTSDVYVGAMKGVLRRLAPAATIIDLTHEVSPQAVLQSAYLLEQAWRYFPPGTVHLAVVDPGVGTSRRRLAVVAGGQLFVGPDNGLLSSVLPDAARGLRRAGENYAPREVALSGEVVAVSINAAVVAEGEVSATFEGRDVFAPTAAYLARGGNPGALGRRVESILAYASFAAPRVDGVLEGLVLQVDRYGNLSTDIRAEHLAAGVVFEVAGQRLALVRTYGDATGLCAIVGSSGFVEIAVRDGSASSMLRCGVGDSVRALDGRSRV